MELRSPCDVARMVRASCGADNAAPESNPAVIIGMSCPQQKTKNRRFRVV